MGRKLAEGRNRPEKAPPAGIVGAIVTSTSIDRLNLRIGDETLALFKATEVMIAKLD